MDDINITSGSFCKNEILAELSFHRGSPKTQSVVLLCSRLLARHRPSQKYNDYETLDQNFSNEIDSNNEHQVEDFSVSDFKDIIKNKQLDNELTQDEKHGFVDINEPSMDRPIQSVSNTEETCSSVLEQFKSLSTKEPEEELNARWLAYWEKNGEKIVLEKWKLKYENVSEDKLSMNICDLYEKHREEQYKIMYWKFIAECDDTKFENNNPNTNKLNEAATSKWFAYWAENKDDFEIKTWIDKHESSLNGHLPIHGDEEYDKHCEEQYYALYLKYINEMDNDINNVEGGNNDNDIGDESSSNLSTYPNNVDNISNFEFIYKYKHFDCVDTRLISAYQTLSLIGYTYDNHQIFKSASVQFLKTNLIKSTRHLNIYRFPKMVESKKCETGAVTSTSSGLDSENTIVSNDNKQDDLSFSNNLSIDSLETSVLINKKKSKKISQKEKREQEKIERLDKELERTGHSYLKNNSKLLKYWKKRYFLFSLFDKGIRLDEESWYSVTPEIISAYIAERCSCYLLVDAFCGCGGNTIQFAKTCQLVIAIDIDPKKIEMARHNAELYGVADRIQFIVGDYYALAPKLKADVVFLSPPWGGPNIMNLDDYKLSNIMAENGGGDHLLSVTRKITSDIALHLPKNINIFDCIKSADTHYVEVQQNVLNSRYNSITVYYNELYGLSEESTVEYLL